MTAAYATAAMAYFDAGWSPLPLPAGAKWPPPDGFTGHNGRTPTRADVGGWIAEQPDANLGIRLPADVLGIDVDHYGAKRGADTIADAEAGLGVLLPATWTATSRPGTPSGIRLYRVPEGLAWVSGLPAVDTIHRGHRYAVAWPSTHPEGRRYVWLTPAGDVADRPPTREELAELPPVWVDYLSRPATSTGDGAEVAPEAITQALADMPKGKPCQHVLRAAGKAAAGGNRYDGHRDAVLALIGTGRRGCPGVAPVLANLRAGYVAQVTTVGDPPRTLKAAEAEWHRLFTGRGVGAVLAEPQREGCPDSLNNWDAYAAAGAQDYAPDPEADTGTGTGGSEPPPTDPGTEAPGTYYADLSWLLAGEPPPRPQPVWVRRSDGLGLFYPARVNGLFGDPETGKTWVAHAAVVEALAAGERVAIIDADHNGPDSTAARLVAMGADRGALADPDRFRYVEPDDANGLLVAVADLGKWAPAVVVLDSLGELLPLLRADSNGNDDVTRAMRMMTGPLLAAGACIIAVDHVTKNPENRGGYAIGAGAKKRAVRGAYLRAEKVAELVPGQVGRIRLHIEKDTAGTLRAASSGAKVAGLFTLDATDPEALTWTLDAGDATTADSGGSFRPTVLMERVSRWLETHPGEHSRTKVEQSVTGKAAYLRQALDVLAAEGWVAVAEVARGARVESRYTHVTAYRDGMTADPSQTRPDPSWDGYTPPPSQTRPPVPTPSRGTGQDGTGTGHGTDAAEGDPSQETGTGATPRPLPWEVVA